MDEMFLIQVRAQAAREILECGSVSLETQIDLHEAIQSVTKVTLEYVSVGGI